jgi:hypothetical protein
VLGFDASVMSCRRAVVPAASERDSPGAMTSATSAPPRRNSGSNASVVAAVATTRKRSLPLNRVRRARDASSGAGSTTASRMSVTSVRIAKPNSTT